MQAASVTARTPTAAKKANFRDGPIAPPQSAPGRASELTPAPSLRTRAISSSDDGVVATGLAARRFPSEWRINSPRQTFSMRRVSLHSKRLRTAMPTKATIEKARRDKREGKSPSTQAGEFVHEEIDKIRRGEHGARS